MFTARLEDAADCCDKCCLEHGVVEAAGLIGGPQVCGGQGVDWHGWHIVCNVLEVFPHWIMWVLKCDDVYGISCKVFGDLYALLG